MLPHIACCAQSLNVLLSTSNEIDIYGEIGALYEQKADDKQSGESFVLNYLPLRHILNMSKSDSHFGIGNDAPLALQTDHK